MNIVQLGLIALSVSESLHLYHIKVRNYSLHQLLSDIYKSFDEFGDNLLENVVGSSGDFSQIPESLVDYGTISPKDVSELISFMRSYGKSLSKATADQPDGLVNVVNTFQEKLNKYISLCMRFQKEDEK